MERAIQAVQAMQSGRRAHGGAGHPTGRPFAFRKRDDRVDAKLGRARAMCELLVSMYERVRGGADAHETLLHHDPARRPGEDGEAP